MKRIPANPTESFATPIPTNVEKGIRLCFSFKYYNEIHNFGLSNVDAGWCASLITKLKQLSEIDLGSFFRTVNIHSAHRYHQIDWSARNIPMKREDFTWIDKDIINNDEEYPFWQLQISQALGRIIGFWSENNTVFYIVLLDPMHNLQPSQFSNYKIRPAPMIGCNYSSLLNDIEKIKGQKCISTECRVHSMIKAVPTENHTDNIFLAYIDDDYLKELTRIINGRNFSDFLKDAITVL